MEIPATAVFLWFFLQGPRAFEAMPLLLGLVWMIHYGNRGWFFPLSIRVVPGKKSSFSVTVMAMGMFVTAIHGYLNARWFTELGTHLNNDWFTNPRFLIGILVYYCGFLLIVSSEAIVRNLRDPAKLAAGESGYRIPFGGGYRFVSSPQYLGELTAWAGFTIMTWGLPGLMIFLISAGNLVPRALATHKWYQEKFPDYPRNRKALIPYVV
jgi:3-oxo-5-alpha-steroid 4-dehydrogenase 1